MHSGRGGALDLKPYAGITNVEGGASSERQGRYREAGREDCRVVPFCQSYGGYLVYRHSLRLYIAETLIFFPFFFLSFLVQSLLDRTLHVTATTLDNYFEG